MPYASSTGAPKRFSRFARTTGASAAEQERKRAGGRRKKEPFFEHPSAQELPYQFEIPKLRQAGSPLSLTASFKTRNETSTATRCLVSICPHQ
jgi:hypothetical protein